jgi:hypothetical protein
MSDYSEIDYRETCRSIAADAIRTAQREGIDEQDAIHEAVDGSEWVIYHGRARFVCHVSQNEDAIVDQLGSDAFAGAVSLQECITRAAYWAMLADVQDVLGEVREELHAEDDAAAREDE